MNPVGDVRRPSALDRELGWPLQPPFFHSPQRPFAGRSRDAPRLRVRQRVLRQHPRVGSRPLRFPLQPLRASVLLQPSSGPFLPQYDATPILSSPLVRQQSYCALLPPATAPALRFVALSRTRKQTHRLPPAQAKRSKRARM